MVMVVDYIKHVMCVVQWATFPLPCIHCIKYVGSTLLLYSKILFIFRIHARTLYEDLRVFFEQGFHS